MPFFMRYPFALLTLGLAGCSAGPTTDGTAKPPAAPLGTLADKNQPAATQPPAPRPATAQAPPPASKTDWPAPFALAPARLCARTATHPATIWMRPGAQAQQFGQLAVGDHVQLAARTADGWVGFNPGSAQAANVGIFRLRWVRAVAAFAPGDSCARLPLVVAPPPAGCLLMAARALPVRQQPAAGATVVSTIPAGSYAQVAGWPGSRAGNWVEVLVPGHATHGYVAAADASFSGPCR